jgi:2-dehydro-3-deoxyphosphogluconate aldolase / (4S)-4-hydroxy-2-oxoglutarate aldolase
MHKQEIIDAIVRQGLLPLYYHEDAQTSLELAQALYNAGIRVIEYTNRGTNAIANFKLLIEERNKTMPGLLLGIGTVKSPNDATDFLQAGADFIICPIMMPAVANIVHSAGKLWIPGCMTVTEIAMAEEAGATLIKLFPGNILGAAFVMAIKEIFPNLLFMPTGGVDTTMENIGDWFKVGVCAVGMGSKLISKKLMEAKDYNTIESETKKVMQIIVAVKNEKKS